MAGIHDNLLTQIGPIHESRPSERPLPGYARRDQQRRDIRDPPVVDAATAAATSRSSGPNGAIQSGALADKCRLHEMLETVRFSLPGFEFLNNLISHALLPASQELRPEIGDVTKVPVETAAGYVQPG